MKALVLVFLGGGTGSLLRYMISKWVPTIQTGFPYATLMVNILGSLLIGILLGWFSKNQSISQNTLLLVGTGFCGGFTTFSAFAFENQLFLKNGDITTFALYTIASITLGILVVFLGVWLVKLF